MQTTQTLPIAAAKEEIISTVAANLVTIIQAETGAGKSTQVTQYLREAGYQVTATQPRVMAAVTLATRVSREIDSPVGQLVGYRTRLNRKDSAATEILYCTHELQLLREMNGHGGKGPQHVLIIDEVHEWDLALETLVAWVKHQHKQGEQLRVVLMSATVDAGPLSEFFDNAPVISVPGRLHDVQQQFVPLKGDDPETTAAKLAGDLAIAGQNTLVFVRGKEQINFITDCLEKRFGTGIDTIGLHGELALEQQERAFRSFTRPTVVIATNVAQTSVTIEGITAVVDLGMENRKEVRNGVEGLFLADISQSDCLQRAGRAGRVREGDYFLLSDTPIKDRPKYAVPEILRSRLDQLVLRLALLGLDASELEFFHQPNRSELVRAKEALIRLGALGADASVTDTGRAMSSMPVDVHHARMLVEAQRRGVTSEVVTIVAGLEAGSVRVKPEKMGRFLVPPAWKNLTAETGSDLLAELDCFEAARSMKKEEMVGNGIHVKNFYKAKDLRARLMRDLNLSERTDSSFDRTNVLKSCVAGMVDHLYHHEYERTYVGTSIWDIREADRNTVVKRAEWVTGIPFNLQIISQRGDKITLKLLTYISGVDPAWLVEVAPHLATSQQQGFRYDSTAEAVMAVSQVTFNGQSIGEINAPATACPEAVLALATALAEDEIDYEGLEHNSSVINRVAMYARRYDEVEYPFTQRTAALLAERLGTVYRLEDLEQVNLRLELADLLPDGFVDNLPSLEPETITVDGVDCRVVYQLPSWASQVFAVISVSADDFPKLTRLPAPSRPVGRSTVRVMENDAVIAQGDSLSGLHAELERHRARKAVQATREEYLSAAWKLTADCQGLQRLGRPVRLLAGLIRELEYAIQETTRHDEPNFLTVSANLAKAKAEIERLTQRNAVVLADDIMAGRLDHPDILKNKEIVREVEQLSIRSGGFVEPITPEQLRQHYLEKLEDNPRVDQLADLDLKLNLDDYIIEDPELELAPTAISLETRKKVTEYEIAYGYENVAGQEVPAGVIRIPLSVYKLNAPEYGKPSSFNKLPHGITLLVEIIDQNQRVLARGIPGEQLDAKLKKHEKGVRRGKNVPNVDEFGYTRSAPVLATAPPPWYKGR